jgi:hypothetical protein
MGLLAGTASTTPPLVQQCEWLTWCIQECRFTLGCCTMQQPSGRKLPAFGLTGPYPGTAVTPELDRAPSTLHDRML